KVRTLLTVLGIVFGTFVLSTSVSTCIGVQETIMREYLKHGELREITVWAVREPGKEDTGALLPVHGEMSEARRQRLEKETRRPPQAVPRRLPKKPLTPPAVEELAALPHVRSARPVVVEVVRASLDANDRKKPPAVSFVVPPDDEGLRERVVAG